MLTTYRVAHHKITNELFWSNVLKNADFSKLLTLKIPSSKLKHIMENRFFSVRQKELLDYHNKKVVNEKITPFLKSVFDYMFMRRNLAPAQLNLFKEKDGIYKRLIEFFTEQNTAIPWEHKYQAIRTVKKEFTKNFPEMLTLETVLIPKINERIAGFRKDLKQFNNRIMWSWLLPLISIALLILFCITPRKIFAWVGLVLIISFFFFIAYSLIVFYGITPSEFFYDQLKAIPSMKVYFNETIINKDILNSYFTKTIIKPLAYEVLLYLIIGFVLIIVSLFLKNKYNKKGDAKITEVQ